MSAYDKLVRQLYKQRRERARARIEAESAVLDTLQMLEHFDPALWTDADASAVSAVWTPEAVERFARVRRALQQLLDQHVLD